MARPAGKPLLDQFTALADPGPQAQGLCPSPEIVLSLLGAALAGADDFVAMRLWRNRPLTFRRRFQPDRHGIPRHDTLGAVIRGLDPEIFKAGFTAWVAGWRAVEPDLIANDGTTARWTHARRRGRAPLHLVSAWASRQRLVLGQEAVAAKSNEITARTHGRAGDHRRHRHAERERRDHPRPRRRLAPNPQGRPTGYAQGRRGVRRRSAPGRARHARDHRQRSRPHRGAPPCGGPRRRQAILGASLPRRGEACRCASFPSLATIALAESWTGRDGKRTSERRCSLSSTRLDAPTFARAVRCHWPIENRLHRVRDVAFRDVRARLRTGHGPATRAVVKPMAINLLRQVRPATSLTKPPTTCAMEPRPPRRPNSRHG